jgi:DNA topoisomerase VI subunit A
MVIHSCCMQSKVTGVTLFDFDEYVGTATCIQSAFQLGWACWRLALLTTATKRGIFYMDVNLFVYQTYCDIIIKDLACAFKVHQSSLNILASAKGLVAGNLKFAISICLWLGSL